MEGDNQSEGRRFKPGRRLGEIESGRQSEAGAGPFGMEGLLKSLENLKRGRVRGLVDKRMREFRETGKSGDAVFRELCFCLLTANYTAEGGIRIQDRIGNGFCSLPESKLAIKLKRMGHRHPNSRANYIREARRQRYSLLDILKSRSGKEAREWLVKNVKGLGWKEASHFLRNIGFEDLAIIDFHIVDLLVREGLIERPNTLTKRKYLETEKVLEKIAKKSGLTPAELDLYLWCLETGKVLK